MRIVRIVLVLAALGTGCGSAVSDAAPIADLGERIDAASGAEETTRPIVGTLRMRDRDIALTPLALEARGNEVLREMTARPVWADVDAERVEEISIDSSLELNARR